MNKDKDNKNNYKKIFLNAYNNGLIKIVWNTSGFSLGIDSIRKKLIPELKDNHFIDYVFSIIRIAMDLAEERDIVDISEEDLEMAQAIFSQENDLKNHLYIKRNSKINCFKLLESQIISYRNEENPKEIDANSAIIKVIMETNDEDISSSFEISRRDLGNIIENLIELKEKMDSI